MGRMHCFPKSHPPGASHIKGNPLQIPIKTRGVITPLHQPETNNNVSLPRSRFDSNDGQTISIFPKSRQQQLVDGGDQDVVKFLKLHQVWCLGENSDLIKRPTANTMAERATVVGCGHRDGTRPTTGHITHRRSNSRYTIFYQKFGSTSCNIPGFGAKG
ncbi:hypothetical protein ACLOJK_019068, partial [Asimina triloba]